MKEIDLRYPTCPIRNVLSRMSDKWSLLVLWTLKDADRMRYGGLRKAIPDISHKMLTSTLKHLEADHLISRQAFAEIPPRVEYSLTETGKSLMPSVRMLIDWAIKHQDAVLS
ncbi:MAG: helix-turn-helix transcriptional regulator [Tannerella sp.]|nr:helix-turn-helix transcriptional regulator [Tannerella sp.]